jgi:hypothetical protein
MIRGGGFAKATFVGPTLEDEKRDSLFSDEKVPSDSGYFSWTIDASCGIDAPLDPAAIL